MFKYSIQKTLLPVLFGIVLFGLICPGSIRAQESDDDLLASSVVPKSVEDLPGLNLESTSWADYATTGRPEDNTRKFVFYNVGTGKFLNVGSYWGSHAALSYVPRAFWLQRRSDSSVSGYPSYVRYPESADGDPGTFAYQFFHFNGVTVGSTEGSKRSYATYRVVACVNGKDTVLWNAYSPSGESFRKELKDFTCMRDGDYIKAEIDMTNVQATASGGGNMETILSIGQDISKWDSKHEIVDLHIYGYRSDGKSYVRVDCIGPDFAEDTHRFGGSRNPIVVGDDNIVQVYVAKGRIEVNGVSCIPSSESVERSISPMLAQNSWLISNAGGASSNAVIKNATLSYYENATEDSSNKIEISSLEHNGEMFVCNYNGRLTSFSTTINLEKCTGTNENVLSIGTNVAVWGNNDGQYNLHFYYTKNEKTLQVATVCALNVGGTDYTKGNKTDIGSISGEVTVSFDADGVKVNGNTVRTVEKDEVLKYLLQQATAFQFGSQEGKSRSHASYENVVIKYLGKQKERKQKTLYADGAFLSDAFDINLSKEQTLDIQADLSACTTRGDSIVALKVNTTNDKQRYGLTFTYLGKDDTNRYVQVAYDDAVGAKDGYTRTVTLPLDSMCHILISSDGLTVCGQEVFPEGNLLPSIAYDAKRVGRIAKMKVDRWGNFVLGENGRFVPDDNGKALREANSGYMYSADDQEADGVLPLFLSSRFLKRSDASSKEGSFLAWTPWANDTQTYGSVGVFADRSLEPKEETVEETLGHARWYFERVPGVQNIYRLSLKSDSLAVITLDDNRKEKLVTQRGTFYLQAIPDNVYDDQNKDYVNKSGTEDYTCVDALNSEPSDSTLGYWKLISVLDYYDLFKGIDSDFSSMLDLSYIMSDPDFIRESAALQQWHTDETLQGKKTEHKVTDLIDGTVTTNQIGHLRIGYDHYSKKDVTDSDYTDENGALNTSGPKDGKWVPKTLGTDDYQITRKKERTHGRYMGVEVREGGHGRFYQEVTVNGFGWYSLSCQGMSNAKAELFIQKAGDKQGEWVSTPLHAITQAERTWLDSPEDKPWPYDSYTVGGVAKAMPLYNALVTINDDNTTYGPVTAKDGESRIARYTSQVVFYVDKKDLDDDGHVTLRMGVYVPEYQLELHSEDVKFDTKEALDAGDNWTVFDNFHLYYGGNAPDPCLVLNEDSTNLDYLDESIHHFADRPMYLHRTFSDKKWNTLILPVTLSKDDFTALFGSTARLAKLDHLTENTVEFKSETEEDGKFLRAYTPYIIWVDNDHAKGKGEAYEGSLYKRDGNAVPNDSTEKIPVSAQAGDFYLPKATLESNYTDADSKVSRYNFREDENAVQDSLYTYQGTLAEGGGHTPLRAYGTLCKNYGQNTEGRNVILEGRPTLTTAYVMNGNNMRRLGGQYGTKGFRCWFMPEATASQESANALRVVIDGVDDGATSLDDLNADDGVVIGAYADGVYNISGQLVRKGRSLDNLPVGIYIVNGLKYMVK